MKERTLKEYQPMQERCSNCSYCKWIPLDKIKSREFAFGCPSIAYYGFNTYSARGRFQVGLAVNNQEDIRSEDFAKVVHSCLECGLCDTSCKVCRYNLEPLGHNAALKEQAVLDGQVLPGMDAYKNALVQKCAAPGSEKKTWADGLGLKNLAKEKAKVLFFTGCKYAEDPDLRQKARFAAKLLQDKGMDLGYLGEQDFCCGEILYSMGYKAEFEQAAKANMETLQKAGVTEIVTPCADCYHAFKRLYAELGLTIRVRHITEVIAELLDEQKLTFTKPINKTVTYHDPCKLGRQGEPYIPWEGEEKKILNQVHTWEPRRPRNMGNDGVYDAPRAILAAIPGLKLEEMERIREYSWCCGHGGGVDVTLPQFSQFTAEERIKEAKATKADALVTACPNCYDQLAKQNGMEIVDILDLVQQAL